VPYLLDGEQRQPQDAVYDAVAQVIDGSNLTQGIPELSELLHRNRPQQPNFFVELGDAERHQGDIDAAIVAYRDALNVDPLSSRAQRRLGAALGSSGQLSEALTVLNQAIAREPANALLLYEKALVDAKNDQPALAVDDLKKCLALKPGFADAENNLGSNLAQLGQLAEAEAAFRRAMQSAPYDSKIRSNLGRNLAARADWPEAVLQLRRALELEGNNFDAHTDLAVSLLQMHQVMQAEVEARSAVHIQPRSAAAHDLLGQIESLQGRNAQAQLEFEAALAADPSFAPAQLDEGELLLGQGRTPKAVALLERAAQAPQPAIAGRARELLGRR
jgi:tetratricopeptide (TPR) repeat protein